MAYDYAIFQLFVSGCLKSGAEFANKTFEWLVLYTPNLSVYINRQSAFNGGVFVPHSVKTPDIIY